MRPAPVRPIALALRSASLACLLVLCLAGCAVGPKYKRAAGDVPPMYRGVTQEPAPQGNSSSLGDEKWWEIFQDKVLQDLIRRALAKNYDLRIAASRVLQAQAQLGIVRADQFPSVNAGGNITSQRFPAIGPIPSYQTTLGQVSASASWIPDFWGKYRRAAEASRAQLLASQWAQQAVTATLVANVSSAYFQIRALDLQLEMSQRTLAARKQSLQLTRTLEEHGFDTQLDVRQAEELAYTAAAQVPDLERQIEQQENSLSILLGNNPGAIPRGLTLTAQPHPPEVPAGLPSALLERRPDIRQAEEKLIAANAQIGVARAAFFPQISLTGSAGYESGALASLFTGPAALWSIGGTLTQPIFQGGRLKSTERLAEAQHEESLLVYRQTIQDAFRDVSNALVAYRKYREFRVQQENLTAAAQDAARLSAIRFKAGTTDYLEVLTNETNSYSDQLTLAQAQLNELQALVQLYQALGGGWQ
jgi:outer membrane protein, multidrug efflux system